MIKFYKIFKLKVTSGRDNFAALDRKPNVPFCQQDQTKTLHVFFKQAFLTFIQLCWMAKTTFSKLLNRQQINLKPRENNKKLKAKFKINVAFWEKGFRITPSY